MNSSSGRSMQSLKFFQDVIRHLEDPRTPFLNVIFTFIGAVTLRLFLEQFDAKSTPISLIIYTHYALIYISMALSLIVLFHFAARQAVDKIARVVLPSFIILPLVPIIDVLISFGRGYSMTYFLPEVQHHLLRGFLLFGGPFVGTGVTPGQQIEVALVIFMSGIYFVLKTDKFLRSVFFAFLTYILIFFYFSPLVVLKTFLNVFGVPYLYSEERMIWFYLLLILPLSQGLFYLYNKQYFIEIWKDARWPRMAHFQLMIILGFAFAHNGAVKQSGIPLHWFFILPAIIFGGLFSIMVNNREDYDVDKISNKGRPTVLKTIPPGHYKNISLFFLGLALIYAGAVNFLCFLIILLGISNYFLYSAPPFRLKRVPFYSKLVISFNSLLLFALGYDLRMGAITVPLIIVLFFLVCFTAAINFIDIKDYAGDKNAGIKTLPTLLGLERSKYIIGLFFFITYTLTYFLVKDIHLLPLMMAIGLMIFLLINRKDYSEKPVFVTYLLSLVLLIVYFLFCFHTPSSFAYVPTAEFIKVKSSFPLFVDPEADLGPQKQPKDNFDSWFVVGRVKYGAHHFGVFVNYMDISGVKGVSLVSITDDITGATKKSELNLEAAGSNKAKHGIDIQTPNITWSGDMKKMTLTGTIAGPTKFKIICRPGGPLFPYMGTGYFPLLNNTNPVHEYAFPAMQTSGTVSFEGRTYQVTGESWFDRQWGPIPEDFMQNGRWTWMAMSLSNGDKIALWDTFYKSEQAFVNALGPDGTITIAGITSLAQSARGFWRSQVTRQNYPTRWTVIIPGQDAKLEVVSNAKDQEIAGRYEGPVKVKGTYKGKLVTGWGWVEMVGHWEDNYH